MPSERPVRSLVVDDARMFADAIRLTLVDMGLDEVVVATTADEALDVVGRAETELVAMAAADETPAAKESVASVFSGVIDKGVERDGFERVIRSVLDGKD